MANAKPAANTRTRYTAEMICEFSVRPKRLATCRDLMANAKPAVNTRTRYTAEMICELSDTKNGGQWQKNGTAETTREVSSNSTFDLP